MTPEAFRRPGVAYGGTTLWMLNDRLEPAELSRQLAAFRDAGWGAVIDRTFNGLRTPYLSPEWHRLVRHTIEAARGLGMRVWLQAGYMPGGIPELAPDSRQLGLHRTPSSGAQAVAGPEDTVYQTRDGWTYRLRSQPHALDLLSKRACAEYIRVAYTECLEKHYGDELGKTVETIWVDEPHFLPPMLPWSAELEPRFRADWGYELGDVVEALFDECGDFPKVRHHYWRTVTSMLLEAYFAPIRAWCEAHGVAFGGHLMSEDTLQAQVSWTGAAMPCYEHMGIPGIDHLTRSLSWPAERPFLITPKQCSSVSNQVGRSRTLAEMYGVSTQGLDFEDRKRIGDWLLMLGINERCYHGSFYTLRGRRKRIYAPHLGPQQPWWAHNRVVSDYFARLCYVLRQGSYEADVLVLHPVESAWCRFEVSDAHDQHDRVREPASLRGMTDALIELSGNLLRIHRGFDYGDESILARLGAVEDGRLRVGRMRYRVVILPELVTIRASTLALLAAFFAAGGPILTVGKVPRRLDGVLSPEPEALLGAARQVRNTPAELEEVLDLVAPPEVRLESVDSSEPGLLWLHTRRVGDRSIHVLHNSSTDTAVSARVVGGPGALESWDPVTGEVRDTRAVQRLAPGQTVILVRTNRKAPAPAAVSAPRGPARTVPLAGPYRILPASPNALPLDFCRHRIDGEEWSERLPVIAVQERLARLGYRGRVRLGFEFRAREVVRPFHVVLEEAADTEITLNGTSLRPTGLPHYMDTSFDVVDASDALRAGENRLELARVFEPPTESTFFLGALFHTSTGTELESVYLTGAFTVACRPRRGPAGCVRLDPSLQIEPPHATGTGDLVHDGYPFYAGEITLRSTLELGRPEGRRVFLVLHRLDSVLARVAVNGAEAGVIAWRPYELDLTPHVRAGANEIALTLVTSLRGLLGPHHRPSGEPDQVWSDAWTGKAGEGRRDTALRSGEEWAEHRAEHGVFWTDDYMVLPLGLGEGGVVEYRPESDHG